jgi:hypothetical protein
LVLPRAGNASARTDVPSIAQLRSKWRAFRALPPGERFQTIHRQQARAPVWVKGLMIAGAVIALGIGVVLSVMPGPAIVFFAVAGVLAAVESRSVARALDRGEALARALAWRVREFRR